MLLLLLSKSSRIPWPGKRTWWLQLLHHHLHRLLRRRQRRWRSHQPLLPDPTTSPPLRTLLHWKSLEKGPSRRSLKSVMSWTLPNPWPAKCVGKKRLRRKRRFMQSLEKRMSWTFYFRTSAPSLSLCSIPSKTSPDCTSSWIMHEMESYSRILDLQELVWHALLSMQLRLLGPSNIYIHLVLFTGMLLLLLVMMSLICFIYRDLKPENILLNDKMHIQVTDFGSVMIEDEHLLSEANSSMTVPTRSASSTTVSPQSSPSRLPSSQHYSSDSENQTANGQSPSSSDIRRRSFVGTAQYVSPEMLSHKNASKASDIWALGCIVYQMMTGSFPFKASTDYLIFQKITKLDYSFPDDFDPVVRDFVESILKIVPETRLGSDSFSQGIYHDIRDHAMFRDYRQRWDSLHEEVPPLTPERRPGDSPDEDEENFDLDMYERGLDERTVARMLLNEENRLSSQSDKSTLPDPSDADFALKLERQSKENVYHRLVENNLIIYQGLVDKWKGILARKRRRMFLLTTGPHLYYVDPSNMVVKGEVPWSSHVRPEAKNFRTFYVHTVSTLIVLFSRLIIDFLILTSTAQPDIQLRGCLWSSWCPRMVSTDNWGPRQVLPRKQHRNFLLKIIMNY